MIENYFPVKAVNNKQLGMVEIRVKSTLL